MPRSHLFLEGKPGHRTPRRGRTLPGCTKPQDLGPGTCFSLLQGCLLEGNFFVVPSFEAASLKLHPSRLPPSLEVALRNCVASFEVACFEVASCEARLPSSTRSPSKLSASRLPSWWLRPSKVACFEVASFEVVSFEVAFVEVASPRLPPSKLSTSRLPSSRLSASRLPFSRLLYFFDVASCKAREI
jgi:hypothetical protein